MKTSKYLEERIESFRKIIDFFKNGSNEQKIIFLAQIDFWDWEMENLIFSISNFRDRAKAWRGTDILKMLEDNRIKLKDSDFNRLRIDRRWQEFYGREYGEPASISAPIADMNDVVNEWNKFLEIVNKKIISEKEIKLYNLKVDDITKYKKNRLEI